MEILAIQRGRITVRVGDHTASIDGESFARPLIRPAQNTADYADYVVYPSTLTHWNKPQDSEPLPAETKAEIITFLKADFTRRGQVLAVE